MCTSRNYIGQRLATRFAKQNQIRNNRQHEKAEKYDAKFNILGVNDENETGSGQTPELEYCALTNLDWGEEVF